MGILNISIAPSNIETTQALFINKSKKRIKGTLRVFYIQDGAFKVVYMPSLNLSGYGKNDKEASKMLKKILDDYFESLVSLNRDHLISELSKYGWTTKELFAKRFVNDTYVDKDGVLKNFELPHDTPIEESMIKVA